MSLPRAQLARALMADFAERTGLDSDRPPTRYLWTDAFAVGADLALWHRTGDESHLDRARRLVDQVHRVLGRHREDDAREGWISGLDEEAGAEHPTAGGLRIGKPLPERGPEEPRDPGLEWERDGQYYHYLTRWTHALERMASETGDARYLRWAVDLARAAHRGFTHRPAPESPLRIHWKMSIDLSRPLVATQGAHDPLDGFTTLAGLGAAVRVVRMSEGASGSGPELPDGLLSDATAELRDACRGRSWVTDDPLGIGGLLVALHRLARLAVDGALDEAEAWLQGLADDAVTSLRTWGDRGPLEAPAPRRLAFRELGLALGLEAVVDLLGGRGAHAGVLGGPPALDAHLDRLGRHVSVARRIEAFWADAAHREVSTWVDHRDISDVMLAASLVPEGWSGRIDGGP